MNQVFVNASTPTVLIHTLVNIFLLAVIAFVLYHWSRDKRNAASKQAGGEGEKR